MAAQSKLTLFLEMKDRLFNNKLSQVKKRFDKATGHMHKRVRWLGTNTVKSFKAMTAEVPLFGRAMEFLGNPYTLLAAGLFSVVSLFGTAITEAKSFNSEFLHIKQLNLDKNTAELSTYKGLIRDSAFETGKSLTETTKSYYDLQSALGAYGTDARTIFTEVANYSTATGANLGDSINSTSKAMKAFNLEAKDTRGLLLSNAKAVQIGITTFDELAKVQTDFAGSAGNIGQTVDTANKLFGVFTAIGKSSAEAGTLTKTFFQGLAQRAGQIEKHLGVKVFDEKGSFKQADSIIKAIGARFEKLSQKQVAEVITKIGGPDGLNQLLTKMKGNAADVFSTFEAFDSSKFDLNKALKNAQGDVTVLSSIVRNRFNVVMATLGEKILPIVAVALNKFNNVLEFTYQSIRNLNKWFNSGKISAGLFKVVLAAIGTVFIANYAPMLAIATLQGVLAIKTGLVAMAQWAWNAALNANPIGLVVGAIVLLIGYISVAIKHYHSFGAAMLFVLGPVGLLVNAFMSLKNNWDSIKDSFKNGGIISGLKRIGIVLLDTLLKPMQQLLQLASKIPGIGDLAGNGADKIQALRKKLNLISPEEKLNSKKSKITKANGNSVLPAATSKTKVDGLGSGVTQDISSSSQKASQPRSITINIEALNKGGINTQNTTLAHKSTEELEDWFNEMMLRVVRNTELSYE